MSSAHPENQPGQRPLLAMATWAGLSVLYLALAGGASGAEVVAGALASLAATVTIMAAGSREHLGRIRWEWWLILIRRLPSQMFRDTIGILVTSLRPNMPPGRFRPLEFQAGGDNPISGSRRALVAFGASMAPGSYVVRLNRRRQELLTHQFPPKEAAPARVDPQWPI